MALGVVRFLRALLGGSWVVLGYKWVSRVTIITPIRGLITPLLTAHEPPSRVHEYTCFLSPFGCKVSDMGIWPEMSQ